jgi:hypothetical protein
MVIVIVPVIIAFVAGLSVRSRVVSELERLWSDIASTGFFGQPLVRMFSTAVLAGFLAAGAGAFLSDLVSGQMGPGRFAVVGPDAATIALWLGVEVGIGVFIGVLSGSLSRSLAGSSR